MAITGTTRLYAILGDPLARVRSPERFNALFAQYGTDAVLVPAEVGAAGFDAAIAGFKSLRNCDGLIITMPHKQAMCKHVDELRDNGRLVGAINVARRSGCSMILRTGSSAFAASSSPKYMRVASPILMPRAASQKLM